MPHAPRIMLGVDIGTTSTKTVAFTLEGRVIAQHAEEYPVLCTEPGMAEQDPQQIFAAMLDSIATAVKAAGAAAEEIALVSFSAAMHSLIALDAQDRLLCNSITWGDIRASVWAERIKRDFDGNAIYRRTGTPIHPMSPLCKLMWLRHEKPEVFGQAARFVGIKEYVLFRLFGQWQVDYSIASATGMFNLRELAWDREALALLKVDLAQLPSPVPTTHRLPALDGPTAQRLGLSTSTPFIIGANDGVLSNLGVNAIAPGHVAVTIGTSGAMRTVIDQPLTDPHGRLFCYALTEQHWVVGGPVNNGGNIFRWVRDELATAEAADAREEGVDPYQALTRIAETVAPGAEGLLFHPFMAGFRQRFYSLG